MKKFEEPMFDMIKFSTEDTITTSGTTSCGDATVSGSDMPCDGNIFDGCPMFDPFADFH